MVVLSKVLDFIRDEKPAVAFIAPEPTGNPTRPPSFNMKDLTIFQYWPAQLQDSQSPNYASKDILGGSHPLKQWTSGSGRQISFEAVFTRELRDDTFARILGTPSTRYTVDIAAARSRIERYKQPLYRKGAQKGIVEAPERVLLSFPNTQLGGNVDTILCYLTEASFIYERWFPDGTPRIFLANLTFEESVQFSRGGGLYGQGSSVRFQGRERWEANAPLYKFLDGDVTISGGGA